MFTAKNLGEREIIKLFLKYFISSPLDLNFFNEDVALVKLSKGKIAVLKCDMLVSSTDVPPGMNFKQVGRKAIVSTVSDFAAKGVKPLALLISLGLPKHMLKNELKQLALGFASGAKEYNVKIIGGDTNESKELVIDCVGYGVCEEENLVFRWGARPGDILASTGEFGAVSAGLKIVLEGFKASLSLKRKLLRAVYMPKAHLKEGLALSKIKAATASIDSSDGLAWSLFELSKMSKVGFVIRNLPITKEALIFAKLNKLNPIELALYGGEEFNLVLTIKRGKWRKAVEAIEKTGGKLYFLGEAVKGKKIILDLKEEKGEVKPLGWEHFKT
ncbi:MAG: thiamine-phosphate kinase [Candidatus Bathyarchaeia archaeon]|nr:thiamine-phosphate kinase [Candidatus Bathyarchaeota archaeon]